MTDLEALLRSLLPASVAVSAGPIEAMGDSRYSEENAAVAAALDRRRNEFLCGRRHARRALRDLGIAGCAILRNADRSPRWPDGVTGSIAHSARSCIAIAASRADHASLGVDVETAGPLDDDLIATVCTGRERDALQAAGAQGGDHAKIVLSAKESVFKALYPIEANALDFRDVEIEIDRGGHRFTAWLVEPARWPAYIGFVLDGAFGLAEGEVVSCLALPRLRST